ncbi:hypothetical protein ACHAXR_006790, partial [Thalassiosira sp. AJA248-18]
SYRVWKLELRTREQDQALRAQGEVMKTREQSFKEREWEMHNANENLQQKYNTMRDEKKRMEASIIERGKAGEEVLGQLLDECRAQNIITDYKLQHEIEPGKRPDAVVEIMDNIFIVIDSKAPNAPNNFDDQSRREYADKLKVHARQLSDKRYNSTLDQRSPMLTLMMLPGEGYLQAAYEHGRDVFSLHKYARDRNVLILGPNGLRTLLQVVKIRLEDQESTDRLKDDRQVHENIVTTLQPLWVESLLPFMKRTSNLLEKIVSTWNSKVDIIVAFDQALRSKDILDLAKARKSQLPKKVSLPKSIQASESLSFDHLDVSVRSKKK